MNRKRGGRNAPSYAEYVYQYKNKQAQLAKKGYTMADTMYTKADYEWMYQNVLNKQKTEVKLGERTRTGPILRDLINDQAYQLTKKQAVAAQKAAKSKGLKGTLQDFMMDKSGLQQLIKDDAKMLYKQGKSSKEVAIYIGQTYYGSP